MPKNILVSCVLTLIACVAIAEEPDHEIHEELRGILRTVEGAINTGEFDKMLPVISEQVRATPINQEFLSSRAEVSRYFDKWFGKTGYLSKLDIHFNPDALTELSPDKTWGIATGNGIEKYMLRDGRPYEMHTRWTATMVKENDGRWRIRGLHVGTNFLDNPILSQAEHAVGKAFGGGVVLGLLVGLVGYRLLSRRKKIA